MAIGKGPSRGRGTLTTFLQPANVGTLAVPQLPKQRSAPDPGITSSAIVSQKGKPWSAATSHAANGLRAYACMAAKARWTKSARTAATSLAFAQASIEISTPLSVRLEVVTLGGGESSTRLSC